MLAVAIIGLIVSIAAGSTQIYMGVKAKEKQEEQAVKAEKAAGNQKKRELEMAKKQTRQMALQVGKKYLELKKAKTSNISVTNTANNGAPAQVTPQRGTRPLGRPGALA
ncbi:MAG: hypothetical protein HYY43_03235 [Deltaproteobacteria bacterium]|nr:hypothetical protein [Deltaproteobacteria bacterium]MBI2974585.1 hypothetical protein [Deltaproteobacteria bacterium]